MFRLILIVSVLSFSFVTQAKTHCDLCTFSVDMKPDPNAVVVFLDMDGVVSSMPNELYRPMLEELFPGRERWTHRQYSELEWEIAKAKLLHPPAVESLNRLLAAIAKRRPVYLVLSSAWRENLTVEQIIQQVFSHHEFSQYFVGKTPCHDSESACPEVQNGITFEATAKEKYGLENLHSRSDQVEFWLKDHGFENNLYLILDDVDFKFSKRFPEGFIHTKDLLSEKHIESALESLKLQTKSKSLLARSVDSIFGSEWDL